MDQTQQLNSTCQQLGITPDELGVIVVDHGSRREASNSALLDVVRVFRETTSYRLVEPAHMELASPTIAQAFDKLVGVGAKFVAVHPYFLLPGRHVAEDIPALVAEAASAHPGVEFIVSSPLGIHHLMAQVMNERIMTCLAHRAGSGSACDICDSVGRCSADFTSGSTDN